MNSYAGDLESSATKGHSLASNTATAMEDIYDATQTINQAIETIESISFQTNILSLNAAVEAATAGEAGKGFAVVAQEVRNLASRSSESASQIRSLVETAQEKTLQGKKISSEMIEGYNHLNEKISQTSTLIDEVANGSDKQLLGIEYINKTIFDLEKMLKNNQSKKRLMI
ncbi:MAG: methyl-accepting chemotaxis protein [Campylobacterota bacterium]|nr:methyl-accepting chemotaxis protein [Campylobacterota bacterium]